MSTRVAICLFEDFITTIDPSILMGGLPLTKIGLNKSDPEIAVYLKKSTESTPDWTEIVKGFSKLNTSETVTASSGAILFIKTKNRVLGCCFGTSVANINKENIVRDFGLAVAYNRIQKKNYKGIETYSLTENPITNNRSAALPSSQNAFNLDSYLETITELSGKHYANSRSTIIKGKEFFSIPAPLNLDDIKDLCTSLVHEYEKTIQNSEFKKITAVNKVKSKKLIDFLNDQLVESINKKSSSVYLVDYQNQDDLECYCLTTKGDKVTELDIQCFYNSLNKGHINSIASLKSRRISIYNKDGQKIDEWSFYKCLFIEFSLNIGGHILYKGCWYEIHKRYLKELKGFISEREIDSVTTKLPKWNGADREGVYNQAAATIVGGQCWDKNLYRHPDFSYGIEFCDILQSEYVIHVKKLACSALNSHLLMQTYVSSQLLKSDPNIKKWIYDESKATFKKNILLNKKHEFKSTSVKYLVVLMACQPKKKLVDVLPFFSLVTLNMMIRRIEQLDFEIRVCLV